MGQLSRAAKERALRGMVGDGLWLGLATGRDGSSLRELQDIGYRRQPVTFGDVTHGARSEIANKAELHFPPMATDAGGELKEWFLITTPSGAGDVVATGKTAVYSYVDLTDGATLLPSEAPVGQKDFSVRYRAVYPRPRAGEQMVIPAGNIVLYIEEGTE